MASIQKKNNKYCVVYYCICTGKSEHCVRKTGEEKLRYVPTSQKVPSSALCFLGSGTVAQTWESRYNKAIKCGGEPHLRKEFFIWQLDNS